MNVLQGQMPHVLLLVIACWTVSVCGRRVYSPGRCPRVKGMADFDISRYTGRWYEYERFTNSYQRDVKCVYAEYESQSDGSLSVFNAGVNRKSGDTVSIEGEATVPDNSKPGELKVKFFDIDISRRANYIVVDTDYSQYAVVFSCTRFLLFPFFHVQSAWILVRDRLTPPPDVDALKAELKEKRILVSSFKLTEQADCSN